MLNSKPLLELSDFPAIVRSTLTTIQVNLGYLCNLSCVHCHVNAGPKRTELMSKETIDQVLAFIEQLDVTTLDLTGGAPEMNPHFKYFVIKARAKGLRAVSYTHLTLPTNREV